MAPRTGFEPVTNRLTGECSTAELSGIIVTDKLCLSGTVDNRLIIANGIVTWKANWSCRL